jgi:hypothetical protein
MNPSQELRKLSMDIKWPRQKGPEDLRRDVLHRAIEALKSGLSDRYISKVEYDRTVGALESALRVKA